MSFDEPSTSAVARVLAGAAHAVGWPVPTGGPGALTQALVKYLVSLGAGI